MPHQVYASCEGAAPAALTEQGGRSNYDLAFWHSEIPLPTSELGASVGVVKEGDEIFTVYVPEGLTTPVVSHGRILRAYDTATNIEFAHMIRARQHLSGGSFGFSGGVLATRDGIVRGVVTNAARYNSSDHPQYNNDQDTLRSLEPVGVGLARRSELALPLAVE